MREHELEQRITDYLSSGGLFNPELMEHDKVRELLIDCRVVLAAERERILAYQAQIRETNGKLMETRSALAAEREKRKLLVDALEQITNTDDCTVGVLQIAYDALVKEGK
jgi:hypothetical protein